MTSKLLTDQMTLISRVQLHYAVQFIAATGAALAPPQRDYSHTTLSWDSEQKLFVGALIPARQPFQVALDPVNLTALILDSQGQTEATLPLHQKTMAGGLDWHKQEIAKRGAAAETVAFLDYPPDDFPDHPMAHGAVFDADQAAARQALVAYYDRTHPLLQQIVTASKGASPIRIWPHHFDMATLITLPGQKNGESKSIGVGLSPGDATYEQPYWYILPWPSPDPSDLPELGGGGHWHTVGWVGAVLLASRLERGAEKESQQQIQSFIDTAVEASRRWLSR